MKPIKNCMKLYEKNKYRGMFDENTLLTISQQRKKVQTLSTEITTLGGLLNSSEDKKAVILKDKDGILLKLMKLTKQELTDPLVLTAICTFTIDLFESPEIKNSTKEMEPYANELENMEHLVPYLGGDKYQALLQMTRRYYDDERTVQKVTDSGAIGETQITHRIENESNKSIDSEEAAEKKQELIKNSLLNLDDEIVSDLFISIINLMKYFCIEYIKQEEHPDTNEDGSKFERNEHIDDICKWLNDNGREAALFACLSVPDDNVKLAVVRCLFEVPLENLDADEIGEICGIMEKCTNIGAGKTELVLSTVYWICYKLANGDPEEVTSSKDFQTIYGEKVMNEAFSIL